MLRPRPFSLLAVCLLTCVAPAEDWPRFLGSRGDATTTDTNLPTQWSAEKNLKWRTALPGPGASSPIVVGDRIFLTCYTGYGDGSEGTIEQLVRHLLCVDRTTGQIRWTKPFALPEGIDEDPYKSYLTQHGYATNTPISDGQSVFLYLGKLGLYAFDLDGNQLWHRPVKSEINETRWGSAASLIFYKDSLIVNAVEENGHIYSMSKADGTLNWEFDTKATLVYATPNLLTTTTGEMELVVPVPEKVYGVDPDSGQQKWFVTTTLKNEMNGSVIVKDDVAYMYGGFRGVGSLAVRGGGRGDVTDSHVVWTSKDTSYISTPVLVDGHLYWLDMNGIANSVNAKTGERIQRRRTPGIRGGRGVKFFASMLSAGDYVYAVSRRSGTFVLKAEPDFPLVVQNQFEDDDSEFNGSPAVSDNQLFLRSNRYLYCIGE
ncbi:MAG: PQQ-binding-like beta-propeller repeat protein [Planctomycetaceae bacterium]|nr:PQQ-binding-like beta-propeller repeat protein [Planctomycetaceae bacterium]